MELVWADGAYVGPFTKWVETHRGWQVEVPFHRQRQAWRYGLEVRAHTKAAGATKKGDLERDGMIVRRLAALAAATAPRLA